MVLGVGRWVVALVVGRYYCDIHTHTFMSSHTHPGIVLLQVVRYHRSGDPLLVSEEGIPSASDVPKCECGAARIFEFQVMCVCMCVSVCVCMCV